jgi:uncharacterized protein YegJ (DUF2314 family)
LESEKKPLVSIVLLQRKQRYMDNVMLARLASKAWGIDVKGGSDESAEEDASYFAVGESPMFIVKGREGVFLVINHPGPYVEDVEKEAKSIRELRLREHFKQHTAWMSVDLMDSFGETDLAPAYRAIGRLIAELADEDCLIVYGTESGKMVVYSPELDEQLRGQEPLAALDYHPHVPVIEIADDHPAMQAAVAEARKRWPEFVSAFESRAEDQLFSVKARISDGEHSEFIWINVTALEDDRIIGLLGNEPVALPRLHEGDKVTTRLSELNDWMYLAERGAPVGGFTVEVLRRHMQKRAAS